MNHKQLKRQIGDNILRGTNYKEAGNSAVLKNNERTAVITLNAMDLYQVKLTDEGENSEERKENIANTKIKGILRDFFNLSLKQAIDNGDEQRRKEINQKAKNGGRVRVL